MLDPIRKDFPQAVISHVGIYYGLSRAISATLPEAKRGWYGDLANASEARMEDGSDNPGWVPVYHSPEEVEKSMRAWLSSQTPAPISK